MKKRTLGLLLALVLALGCVAGGTLAYLTDQTDTITNTFTVGHVKIDLQETKAPDGSKLTGPWSAKLTPGASYSKDPQVSVRADSEDCYLFVKFAQEENEALVYTSALTEENGWTQLTGSDNVWYRVVRQSDSQRSWKLIEDDTVAISAKLNNDTMPQDALTLNYTAYAVQTAGFDTAEAAWTEAGFTA